MSLSINLSTHGNELRDSYKRIVSGDPGLNWAIYTYEKGGNDLKVQDTGSGGLSELEDEFSDGKIQYAFARVTDPNTELPKFVLINWCGAGVPEVKKGLFHSHSQDVANFLKGYHVSINAREESEVDPGQIMRKVRDSSGSKYSVHNESGNKYNAPSETVKSAYTPVKVPDIAAMQRAAPQDKLTAVGTNYVPTKVDMAALKGQKATQPPITSFNKPAISAIPPPPQSTVPADDEWDADDKDDAKPISTIASRAAAFGGSDADKPVVSSLNSHRAELEALRSGKLGQSNQESSSGPVGTQWEPVSLPKPKPLTNRFPVQTTTPSTPAVPRSAASGPSLWEQKRAQAAAQDPTPDVQEPTVEDTPDQADADADAAAEEGRLHLEKLRIQEEEDQKAEASAKEQAQAEAIAAAEQHRKQEEKAAVLTATAASAGVAAGSEIAVAQPPPVPETNGATATAGTTAVVLFEYEAGEPNEIDLVEGQIITDVDQVDEGWWEGTDPSGKRGLFPSNYVEIQAGGAAGASGAHHNDASNASAAAAAAEEARLREEKEARMAEEEAEQQRQEEEAAAAAAAAESEAAASAPSAPGVGSATATALYEYDAQEENEISFREGEVITEIEMVADDWWQGSVNGQTGLFPANYVEMQ